jgi:hypothetical protein
MYRDKVEHPAAGLVVATRQYRHEIRVRLLAAQGYVMFAEAEIADAKRGTAGPPR